MPRQTIWDIADRFWERVDKNGPNGCWIWLGYRGKRGYGLYQWTRGGGTPLAHRIAYILTHGEVPLGLPLDHLCRNTSCVNPDHLEPVPQRVNVRRGNAPAGLNARKTHCDYGHEYAPENTYYDKRGNRICRICANRRRREWRRRVRAKGGVPS